MKIYFCGSIRGGRERAALYGRMIEKLKEYGEVLTEHVGSPSLTAYGGDGGNAYIFRRDSAWLREAELVAAECSTPSLGVGYELGAAAALGKRVLVFYGGEPGRLSAMVAGNPDFQVYTYKSEEELMNKIEEVMEHERA